MPYLWSLIPLSRCVMAACGTRRKGASSVIPPPATGACPIPRRCLMKTLLCSASSCSPHRPTHPINHDNGTSSLNDLCSISMPPCGSQKWVFLVGARVPMKNITSLAHIRELHDRHHQ